MSEPAVASMELREAIEGLRAVRQFRDDPPDRETIRALIEVGLAAPSASNVQGWRFLLIDDPQLKQRLVAMGGSRLIGQAPVGLLVTYDNRTSNTAYADHIHSAAAAIQNILLRAHELGVGGCWICRLPKRSRLKRLLNIPWCYDPVAYVALGYPLTEPPPGARRKRTVDEVLATNRFACGDVDTSWWLRVKWWLSLRRRRLIRWSYFNGTDTTRRWLERWL